MTELNTIELESVILQAESKKQVLEKIACLASEMNTSVNSKDVVDLLQKREKLGSTGIGHGVAIPHARIPSLNEPLCIALRLTEPVHFNENSTEQPVNIVFALLVPEKENETHLSLLSEISQRCSNEIFRQEFRSAPTNQALNALIQCKKEIIHS